MSQIIYILIFHKHRFFATTDVISSIIYKTWFLVIVKHQSSQLVYLNIIMHTITNNNVKIRTQLFVEVQCERPEQKHHFRTSCVLSDALNSRPQLGLWVQLKHFSEKLLLSQKLRHFRDSHFPQCFILSAAHHSSLPSKFLCLQLFWVTTNSAPVTLMMNFYSKMSLHI